MGISPTARAVLFGAAFFISGAGAAWEVYRESETEGFRYLDFDGRPIGYCLSVELEGG
jgi:hypothetical protein